MLFYLLVLRRKHHMLKKDGEMGLWDCLEG